MLKLEQYSLAYFSKIKKALKYKERGFPNFKIARLTDLPLEVVKELDERKIFALEDLEVSKK